MVGSELGHLCVCFGDKDKDGLSPSSSNSFEIDSSLCYECDKTQVPFQTLFRYLKRIQILLEIVIKYHGFSHCWYRDIVVS